MWSGFAARKTPRALESARGNWLLAPPWLAAWDSLVQVAPGMIAPQPFSVNRFLHILLAAYALVWISAAITPRDWQTWALENLLVVIFVGILVLTYRRFAFSNLSYLLIATFLSLHAIGAHTGYADTPVGDWLQGALGLGRNPYDRVIHGAFGLLLTYPVRELLIRTGKVRGWAANWLPVSLVLAASSSFEVIEAGVAEVVSPGTGPAWLGAQGDEWDAQLDMAASLLGAVAAMLNTWVRERAGTVLASSP